MFIHHHQKQQGNPEGIIIDICIEYDYVQNFEEWENLISTTINNGFPEEAYTEGLLDIDYIEENPVILLEASQGVYL